jgi:hypothetical protein
MSSYSRCMGIKYYEPQCQNCERLPRDKHPEDEDGDSWMTPKAGAKECDKYRPNGAYREADARAILDEVGGRR